MWKVNMCIAIKQKVALVISMTDHRFPDNKSHWLQEQEEFTYVAQTAITAENNARDM